MVHSRYSDHIRRALEANWRRWHRRSLVERLWNADPTVWSHRPVPELADRLGWLRLHETMAGRVEELTSLADQAAAEVDDVVLLGMGGSSLAPEVFASVFGSADGRPRLTVLDSTHPAAVAGVAEGIDPGRTLFVVSSKSGTTLETLSLFRHFWALTSGDGRRFVAVTDPGTPLEALGSERGFRAVVCAPPEVGGRYSALTPFGLLPAALVGVDVSRLLGAAAGLSARVSHPAEPALDLGALWGALAISGRDKLTVLTSPGLAAFPAWLEQLVAESLGKSGTGIVPVADEPLGGPEAYGDDRAFLVYRLASEPAVDTDPLADAGHPVTVIDLSDRYALGAEMLRAELATAAAGEVIGVHPFDQPNVEEAKRLAKAAMAGELDLGSVETNRVEDLDRHLEGVGPGDYVAIHAYLAPDPLTWAKLTDLRVEIRDRTGASTTVGWGPRFLHSTGQLHKGGPGTGVFIQLVDRPSADLPVPETDQTFGRIIAAQAAGDHQALVEAGRRVMRIEVEEGTLEQISEVVGESRRQ